MPRPNEGQPRQQKCASCGKMFVPAMPHHRTCSDCFRGPAGGRTGYSRESRPPPPRPELPAGYLTTGYFDKDGNIYPDLVNSLPEEIARRLGVGGVTSTQLRRFYTKAKTAEQRLDAGTPFASVVATILELQQHAANAAGKAKGKGEQAGLDLLKEFIDRNVGLARQNERAFRKGFLLHFQGVLAYFKYLNPKK